MICRFQNRLAHRLWYESWWQKATKEETEMFFTQDPQKWHEQRSHSAMVGIRLGAHTSAGLGWSSRQYLKLLILGVARFLPNHVQIGNFNQSLNLSIFENSNVDTVSLM